MNPPKRFLCSQLVELRGNSGDSPAESIVHLEEIWQTGAILESKIPVNGGAEVELKCGLVLFSARIVGLEPHEFGWRFEVEFSAATPWDPLEFQPNHLLDPSAVGRKL